MEKFKEWCRAAGGIPKTRGDGSALCMLADDFDIILSHSKRTGSLHIDAITDSIHNETSIYLEKGSEVHLAGSRAKPSLRVVSPDGKELFSISAFKRGDLPVVVKVRASADEGDVDMMLHI